jgi:hypothetical protein
MGCLSRLFAKPLEGKMDDLIAAVRDVLASTPERWQGLARHIPAELLAREPARGEWSALECLQHIVDTEEAVFAVRVQAFLDGRDFTAFNPDQDGGKSAGMTPLELADRFARAREVTLGLLAKVTPADLDRRARHPELGMVTLGEMLNELAAHDLNHLVQAERALMQPFIQDCGPWAVYFAEHVAKRKDG